MADGQVLFQFREHSDLSGWRQITDDVMGGHSECTFTLNDNGKAEFAGNISIEDNGGFASVRHEIPAVATYRFHNIVLKLKGDGKKYQLRIKKNIHDYYDYSTSFETTGEWQTVAIKLKDMYPNFRGRKLDLPYFKGDRIEEVGLLISNKRTENFKLIIDSIILT